MENILPQTYLIGLIGLLLLVAILVGRQLLRVRQDESKLIKLEKQGISSSNQASELYDLASVQLKKRLYPQAASTLRKALKRLKNEPDEAKALIENALGFSLAAQDEFESAISHYKSAIKAKSDYPVALNNLAFAKQRLQEYNEAKDLYQQVLSIDRTNKTAIKQLKSLEKRKLNQIAEESNSKGF